MPVTITHDALSPVDEVLSTFATTVDAFTVAKHWSNQRPGITFHVRSLPEFRLIGSALYGKVSMPPMEAPDVTPALQRRVGW